MADAAHLAVMERKGISHMASSDSDYMAVSNITLWTPD
jgi:predicted nucleic acid-binding protein